MATDSTETKTRLADSTVQGKGYSHTLAVCEMAVARGQRRSNMSRAPFPWQSALRQRRKRPLLKDERYFGSRPHEKEESGYGLV